MLKALYLSVSYSAMDIALNSKKFVELKKTKAHKDMIKTNRNNRWKMVFRQRPYQPMFIS